LLPNYRSAVSKELQLFKLKLSEIEIPYYKKLFPFYSVDVFKPVLLKNVINANSANNADNSN